MTFPQAFPFHLASFISLFCIFTPIHGYPITKQRLLLDPISQISVPPSPAPEASSPSYNTINPDTSSVFNVVSFGAVGDGVSDDTKAFKMAWDTACQAGSAVLLVPGSHSFIIQPSIFTGPCKSSLVFQKIDGTVMAPEGPDSWPRNSSKRQWLVFYKISGLLLQGGGVVDGRGEKWWNLPCKPHKGVKGTTASSPCDSPVVSQKA